MNPNVIKEKWREFKTEVIKYWTEITEDELEQTKGDISKISEIIQNKYDETQRSIQERLAQYVKNVKTENKNEQPNLAKRKPQKKNLM